MTTQPVAPSVHAGRAGEGASASPSTSSYRVAIVGGGITGLATAWYVRKQAAAEGLRVQCTVLEQSAHWGGKIVTDSVSEHGHGPFLIEGGPDSFLTQKPWALELARQLGLERQLLATNDAHRTVYVVRRGRLVPMPEGMSLIAPTRWWPFARSSLISPIGKVRMALDLLLPPKRDGRDEALATFIRRRLGTEALEMFAEPLLAGIYSADPERQSIMATFPGLRQLEATHGSLIRGLIEARRQRDALAGRGPRPPAFISLRNGLTQLVDALVEQLRGALHARTDVRRIRREANCTYKLELRDGSDMEAHAVAVTCRATVAAQLINDAAPTAARELSRIRYESTANLSLAFHLADVPRPLDGLGLLVPRTEGRPINAVTWTSTKLEHRAPAGYALLRVFVGGARHPDLAHADDSELVAIARQQLAEIMGIRAEPVLHRLYRWSDGNPQYDVGHLDRVDAIEAALPPSLQVIGSHMRGVGIPDCVHQAQGAARSLLATLKDQVMPTHA